MSTLGRPNQGLRHLINFQVTDKMLNDMNALCIERRWVRSDFLRVAVERALAQEQALDEERDYLP